MSSAWLTSERQLEDAPRQTSENQRELTRLKATKIIPVAQRYATLPRAAA